MSQRRDIALLLYIRSHDKVESLQKAVQARDRADESRLGGSKAPC